MQRPDRTTPFRPRKVTRRHRQTLEPQLLVAVLVGEPCASPTWRPVLLAQPPAKPLHRMRIDCPVRLADRTQTEVVRPTSKSPIEFYHLQLNVDQQPAPVGQFANGAAYLGDALLRRARADIGSARLRRITSAEGVTQETKRGIRYAAKTGVFFVHSQL